MIDILEAEYVETLCHISKIVSDGKSNFKLTFITFEFVFVSFEFYSVERLKPIVYIV